MSPIEHRVPSSRDDEFELKAHMAAFSVSSHRPRNRGRIAPTSVTLTAGAQQTGFHLTYLPTNRSGTVTLTASYLGSAVSTTVPSNPWPTMSITVASDVLGTGNEPCLPN